MSIDGQVGGRTVSLKIELPIAEKTKSTWISNFKDGPLYLVCLVVGWGVATGINYFGSDIDRGEYNLAVARYRGDLSKDLDAVRAYLAVQNYSMAQALLDDNQAAAKSMNLPPSAMVKLLNDQIVAQTLASNGPIELPSSNDQAIPVLGLTKDILRDQLYSPDRRDTALAIAAAFKAAMPEARNATVKLLLDTVIPSDEDDQRRYRVNIYIALTLSLLPTGSITDPAEKVQLMSMRQTAEYKSDSQFRLNVDTAIARQASKS